MQVLLSPIRRRWPILTLLVAMLLGGCASLETQQRKWIFMASQAPLWSTGQIDGMDDVWIEHVSQVTGRPVKLHGLWMANTRPDAPVMLYLHGARRNVAGSAFRIRHMQDLGFNVLAVDYRGFGQSTEELPSESMVYEDARAAWGWIERQFPGRDRYIFGHSLGGAIAVQLATEVADSKGLIVEAPSPPSRRYSRASSGAGCRSRRSSRSASSRSTRSRA